jgi:hypothetical protein
LTISRAALAPLLTEVRQTGLPRRRAKPRAPRTMAAAAGAPVEETLTVLTYNVWFAPDDLEKRVRPPSVSGPSGCRLPAPPVAMWR